MKSLFVRQITCMSYAFSQVKIPPIKIKWKKKLNNDFDIYTVQRKKMTEIFFKNQNFMINIVVSTFLLILKYTS